MSSGRLEVGTLKTINNGLLVVFELTKNKLTLYVYK